MRSRIAAAVFALFATVSLA